MPLNAAISLCMISLGLSAGALGRWGAHRLGDFLSGSDHYSRRVELHKSWSEDRVFRNYANMMGGPLPFETRSLPVWMDRHRKMVFNLSQYSLTQWCADEVPRNDAYYENKGYRAAIEAYDMVHADTKPSAW